MSVEPACPPLQFHQGLRGKCQMIEASALWNQPLTSVACVLEQINSLRSERHYRHATGEFRTVGISKRRSDQCRPEQEVPLQGTIPLSMSPWAVANIGAVFLELTQMCTSIPVDAANLTIDSRTDTGNPGVLTVITEGPVARQIGKLTADERKKAVLDAVAERFGDKALSPVDYLEQNWAIERYSAGAMISHTPPGRAHRVRPRPSRTLRPHSLGRNRNLGQDVRIHRQSRPLGRACRGRGDSTRSDNGGLTRPRQEFYQRCEPSLRLRLPHMPLIGRPGVGGCSVDDQLEQPRLVQARTELAYRASRRIPITP